MTAYIHININIYSIYKLKHVQLEVNTRFIYVAINGHEFNI